MAWPATTQASATTRAPQNVIRNGTLSSLFPSYPGPGGEPDPKLTIDKLFVGTDTTAWFSGGTFSGTDMEQLTWATAGAVRIRRIVSAVRRDERRCDGDSQRRTSLFSIDDHEEQKRGGG